VLKLTSTTTQKSSTTNTKTETTAPVTSNTQNSSSAVSSSTVSSSASVSSDAPNQETSNTQDNSSSTQKLAPAQSSSVNPANVTTPSTTTDTSSADTASSSQSSQQADTSTQEKDETAQTTVDTTSTSYTVKSGDTLWSIAQANGTSVQVLLNSNNITTSTPLVVGQVLHITRDNGGSVPTTNTDTSSGSTSGSGTTNVTPTTTPTTTPTPTPAPTPTPTANTYAVGQCTWFVKNALSWVGNYWGNASQWIFSGASAGHVVNHTASVGSVAVFTNGSHGADPTYGHVAVVIAVNNDGTIRIAEGNFAGLDYHERTITTDNVWFIHQ